MNAPVLKRIVVASYETTDGKTFATKSEAQAHQRDLSRMADIEKLVKFGMTSGVMTVNDQLATEISAFILAYADDLREILPKRALSAPAPVAAPIAAVPELPAQPLEAAPPAPTVAESIEAIQNGQLPVNPLADAPAVAPVAPAAAVAQVSEADAELAELMAGLDLATA